MHWLPASSGVVLLVSIALIGLLTALAGRMLGDLGSWGNWLVDGIFFVFGLHLWGLVPMPWSGPGTIGMQRKGLLTTLLLGLVFGIALGPCTFAFMGPVLGVAFAEASNSMLYASLLLLAYGLGHCAVIVFAEKTLRCSGDSRRHLANLQCTINSSREAIFTCLQGFTLETLRYFFVPVLSHVKHVQINRREMWLTLLTLVEWPAIVNTIKYLLSGCLPSVLFTNDNLTT